MVRIGILGTGFGTVHAKIYQTMPEVQLIGICGRTEEKTNTIASELQITPYTSVEALITHPDIDVIDVVLPTALHKEYVIRALRAGKHVFCETPIAFTLEDALEMQQVAHETGQHLMIGLFMLFAAEFTHARTQIDQESFGPLRSVSLSRRTPRIWGNMSPMLLTLMIHDFDYVYAILGSPTAVRAHRIQASTHAGEHIIVTLQYPSCDVRIEGSSLLPGSSPFRIDYLLLGEHQAIEIQFPDPIDSTYSRTRYAQYGEKAIIAHPSFPLDVEYSRECQYVVDTCLGKEDGSRISITTALHSFRMAIAAQESLDRNGDWITV